jgi:hypothetical protein
MFRLTCYQYKQIKQFSKHVNGKTIYQSLGLPAQFGYAQTVEIKNEQGILYGTGLAAMRVEGQPSSGDIPSQLAQETENQPGCYDHL